MRCALGDARYLHDVAVLEKMYLGYETNSPLKCFETSASDRSLRCVSSRA